MYFTAIAPDSTDTIRDSLFEDIMSSHMKPFVEAKEHWIKSDFSVEENPLETYR